jgi:aldehyde dehydrogenase (NAD+)
MLPEAQLYIDGQVRGAESGRTYDVIGPWTGQPVGKAADASARDVGAAIAAARRAFDETDWSTHHERRRELVAGLGELMRAERGRLVDLARNEGGSPLGAVQSWHVAGALDGIDTLLSIFPEIGWRQERGRAELYGRASERWVVLEAVGVVGAITPWNAPLFVNVAKVVSALLAGCTVVLKPAPNTPGQGAIMGELAARAGFPPGVFNVVTSADPAMAGEMLTSDRRVDLITFTGSTAVGRRIMERGAGTLKRVFLELGGKSASIVLDDTPDFAAAVGRSIVTYHAGQGCAYTTRLLVPRGRYGEAIAALEQAYVKLGDGWGGFDDPTHVMGPVISQRQLERVLGYIELGREEGARLLAGGRARPDKGGGFFVEPTCFVDVTNSMRIAREEIFGPVLVVIPFEDDEDAIRIANDSDYGLAGAVASADRERALRVARRIRSGAISVNGGMAIAPDLPFGGYKSSGVGREWGLEGIEEYLETKVIAVGLG